VIDRVAIVVGAGGLLGRTVASKLAADGFTWSASTAARKRCANCRTARWWGTRPIQRSRRRSIEPIVAEVGPPAVLVNTLGAFTMGDRPCRDTQDLRLMIDVNAERPCG